MHACAHDGHTAIGLVLAERIAALADRLTGRIKLFFQPAEEGCRGGKALAAGGSSTTWTPCWHCTSAFTRAAVSWWSTPPSFSVQPNSTWSSWGKPPMRARAQRRPQCPGGGLHGHHRHARHPRHRDGMTRINVGQLNGGSGRNVIPGHARLMGETRGATPALNDYMFNQVQQIVEGRP
jgi:aminobenzoyl-glutamate utilization protein A